MTWFEWAEALSYVVTIFGLPLAILVFVIEQRRERQNEEEEIYQRLSDEYTEFLKLVLDNPDLHLLRKQDPQDSLTDEQSLDPQRGLIEKETFLWLSPRAFLAWFFRQAMTGNSIESA